MSGVAGRLIRFGQWINGDGFKDYEHAFVYLGNAHIIEAEPGGARVADVTEYGPSNVLWSSGKVILSDAQRSAVVEAAKSFVGVPYSFLDYLLIALKRFHITVPILNRRVIGSKHMICSQLVAEVYKSAGVDLLSIPTYEVTPADLANFIKE
jgi:uncharacterized protein YycO